MTLNNPSKLALLLAVVVCFMGYYVLNNANKAPANALNPASDSPVAVAPDRVQSGTATTLAPLPVENTAALAVAPNADTTALHNNGPDTLTVKEFEEAVLAKSLQLQQSFKLIEEQSISGKLSPAQVEAQVKALTDGYQMDYEEMTNKLTDTNYKKALASDTADE